jgi:drug/metabolite transporter (DMT)-like permease
MTTVTLLKALTAIALWGASFIATKIALRELTPLTVVVLRFALGVGVLLAILAWRHEARMAERRHLPWLLLLGLNGITVHQLLQSTGLLTTTATNSGWMVALIPIFTAVLAKLMLHEAFGPQKMAGLAVASLGAAVIVGRGHLSPELFRHATLGDGLVLLSAANWALFTTLSKRVIGRYTPAVMMAHVMTFGWLATLPLFAVEGGWQAVPALSSSGWASVLFLGVGCSGLAYAFWYDALAHTAASSLASFLYVQPIVTVAVAAVVLGEPVTWPVAAGGAAILFGVWLVNRGSGVRVQGSGFGIQGSQRTSVTRETAGPKRSTPMR